jgi:hypothetical protein
MDIADQPRCGRPRIAATERNKQKFDELIRQDRRKTVREIGDFRISESLPVCLRVM